MMDQKTDFKNRPFKGKLAQGLWQMAQDSGPSPYLMLVLHGRGDSLEGFTWLQSELNIPHLHFLLLNAPDPYYGGFSWYDLPPNQLPGVLRSRKILEVVMEEVRQEGFLPEKCFLFGFSQGCLMTLEFGGRSPQPFAGFIGVSGYCLDPQALIRESSEAARKGHWLVTHGLMDSLLPVEKTRAQVEELKAHGFPIDYQEYSKDHTIDPFKELPYLRAWIMNRMR